MTPPVWLPPALSFGGHWETFIETVYQVFEQDFKHSRPSFRGLAVHHDSRIEDGREVGFWHIVQRDDATAGERVPDLKRCERIPWPKPTIDHSTDSTVSVWENERKTSRHYGLQKRVLIWLEEADYLVVMTAKEKFMILVTAFRVDDDSYKEKLRNERDEFYKKQKPPQGAT